MLLSCSQDFNVKQTKHDRRFFMIPPLLPPVSPSGGPRHRLGLHRLHRGHDPLPSLALLVRHVLPHAGEPRPWQHVRHHRGHPHSTDRHFQSPQGISYRLERLLSTSPLSHAKIRWTLKSTHLKSFCEERFTFYTFYQIFEP